jgi:hypothetical protein
MAAMVSRVCKQMASKQARTMCAFLRNHVSLGKREVHEGDLRGVLRQASNNPASVCLPIGRMEATEGGHETYT